jgi:hypothetical protein
MSDSILEFVDNKTIYLIKTTQEFIQKLSVIANDIKNIKRQLKSVSENYYCKNSLENMTKKVLEILKY